jgi:hypothetical protein
LDQAGLILLWLAVIVRLALVQRARFMLVGSVVVVLRRVAVAE